MQFGLRTLFLVFFVLATALAAFGPAGLVVAPWLVATVVSVRVVIARRSEAAMVLVLVLLLSAGLWSAARSVRRPRGSTVSRSVLRQIHIALRGYHIDYGRYPPAYLTDAKGRPMHGWRVLLLPYLEEKPLYDQYRWDEPWDGPHNGRLIEAVSWPYYCGRESDFANDDARLTDVVAVTGRCTAWRGDRGCKLAEIQDPANTVLLVEAALSDIVWTEPRDLSINEILSDMQGLAGAITSHHNVSDGYFRWKQFTGGSVLMADGSVHYLAGLPSAEELAELARIDGPKKVTIKNVELRSEPPLVERIRWDHVVGLPLFVVSFLLLVCRPLPKRLRPDGVKGRDSQP